MDSGPIIRNKIGRSKFQWYSDPMLRAYRCAILAAFSWPLLAAGPPREDKPKANANSSAEIQRPLASTPKKAGAPPLKKPCGEHGDQRDSDLCAQWKAVDAAESATKATWLFGTIGSLIGGLTLAAAFSAAKWAKRAAKANRKANRITQLIGQIEVGASVSVTGLNILEDADALTAFMTITNSGKSNGVSVEIESVLNIYAIAGNITNFVLEYQAIDLIDPNGSRTISWKYPLTEEQVEHRSGWAEILVFGFVKYKDVFDETIKSEFCFRNSAPIAEALDMIKVPMGEVYGRRPHVQRQVDDYREVPHPGTVNNRHRETRTA